MPNTEKLNYRSRREAHLATAAAQRKRKRRRKHRAQIHEAMNAALAMKRSKKKGTADLDANMLALGWKRLKDSGPPEERFRKLTSFERLQVAAGVEV